MCLFFLFSKDKHKNGIVLIIVSFIAALALGQAAIAQKRELFQKLAAENLDMAWAFGAK